MDNGNLDHLKAMWLTFKHLEDAAKNDKLGIEAQILEHFPKDKLEGSITNADYGITVGYKLTRTVDSEAVQAAWYQLSANAQKAFKVKFELDLKQYRAIEDLDQSAYMEIAKCVTTKPAKPSITIKG